MAKLILSMDGLVLKEILLTKERMTVGRKASNDIQIDNCLLYTSIFFRLGPPFTRWFAANCRLWVNQWRNSCS